MGDLTLGSKLRAAREIKGVDISTAAEKTKILPQLLRELEDDDFRRIAAPIYAKGFIRTYCSYLNIDPLPLVEEYMSLSTQGQDMKSATHQKAAKKNKPLIPILSKVLPKINLKKTNVSSTFSVKTGIGIVAVIIVIVLIRTLGAGTEKKEKGAVRATSGGDQLISEPQDIYLIKPGVVETR